MPGGPGLGLAITLNPAIRRYADESDPGGGAADGQMDFSDPDNSGLIALLEDF